MNQRMTDFFMNIAEQCSTMSRAVRAKVGCVVVKNNNIISFSWNGTPAGWDNVCEYKDYVVDNSYWKSFDQLTEEYPYFDDHGRYRLLTKPETMHAERNALDKITKSHENSDGASLFVTMSPCVECAKSIHATGIKHVVYRDQYRNTDGLDYLSKANIQLTQWKKQ